MLGKRIIAWLLAAALAVTLLAAPAAASEAENGLTQSATSISLHVNQTIVYGSACGITVTTNPSGVPYIAAAVGVSGAAKGTVYLLLPEQVRILLKLIPLPSALAADQTGGGVFTVYDYAKQLIDGRSVQELLRVAEEIAVLLDALDAYFPSLDGMADGIRGAVSAADTFLPSDLDTCVWLDEEPTPAGRYLLGAVTLDTSSGRATAVKTFQIRQKSEDVQACWSAELPKTLTQAEAAAFDFSAQVQDGGETQTDTMQYLYTGWSGWKYYRSSTPPTKPGRYTQRASADGNYKTSTIRRTFTITK
jgi:hypothetical protein